MCLRPLTTETGVQVSCRSCDECIGQRRFDWVSRAMAERAVSRYTLAVTLSYNDETQENRDGAKQFRYSDVRKLAHRLRWAIYDKTRKRSAFRFLVAGEQGDQNGRCHWHCIFFSDVDLLPFGKWVNYLGKTLTDPERIISPFGANKPKFRLSWSMWPHGFTVVQLPDEGGMNYALSYALKDQFAVDKSASDRRYSRSENYATGLFRMSKAPPIGWPYVANLLAELRSSGQVLPQTKIQVPDLRGFWYPRGTIRKALLSGLRDINDSVVEASGRPCSQWSSLLVSCADNPSDLEVLIDGDEEEEQSIEASIGLRSREYVQRRDDARIAAQCGGVLPCIECCRGLPPESLGEYGIRRGADDEYEFVSFDGQEADFEARGSGLNGGCYLRGARSRLRVFPSGVKAPSGDGASSTN